MKSNRLYKKTLIVLVAILFPINSMAMSQSVKSVLTGGAYGALAGTAVGLVSYPFTGEIKTIFMGASLGLWVGMGVGLLHNINRDNPDNPLSPKYGEGIWKDEFHPAGKYANKAINPSPLYIEYQILRLN